MFSATATAPSASLLVMPRAEVPAGCPIVRLMVANDRNRAQWIKLPVDARQDTIDNVMHGKRLSGWTPVLLAEVSERAFNAARAQAPVVTPPPATPVTLATLLDAWVDGEVDLVARPARRAPGPELALVAPTTLAALEQQDAQVSATMQRAIASVARETGVPVAEIAELVAPAVGIADAPAPWSTGATLTSTGRGIHMKRAAHFEQPPAREALRALYDEVVAEDRRDVVIGLADVQLTPQITLVRAATDDREALSARVEGPGLARLQQEMRSALKTGELGVTSLAGSSEPALRAAASNTWNACAGVLGQRERTGATRAQVTLRTRRVAQDSGDRQAQVYAVVSDSYGEVDTDKIASACLRLVDRLGGDMRATVAYDRERVRIDISTSDLTGDIQVGDEFRKVIRVRSNDAGRGGLHVSSIAERVACLNGNVISAEGAHTVIRHLGDSARLQERLREALAAATGALRIFSRQWVAASQRSIVDGIEPADRDQRVALASLVDDIMASATLADLGLRPQGQALLDGAYRGILRQHELVPAKQVEEHVAVLRAAHWDSRNAGGARNQHGGLSRAALANGLTLWSQQQPMAIAHQTEVVAGRVISGEEVLGWIARKD